MVYFYKYHENNIHHFLKQKEYSSSSTNTSNYNGTPLKKVSSQRVLGITIDEDLTLTPHVEYITSRCKEAYNRFTLFPDMRTDFAVQVFKSFICSKLEYSNIIWVYTIYTDKHRRPSEAAQKCALTLILNGLQSDKLNGDGQIFQV